MRDSQFAEVEKSVYALMNICNCRGGREKGGWVSLTIGATAMLTFLFEDCTSDVEIAVENVFSCQDVLEAYCSATKSKIATTHHLRYDLKT